MEVVDGDGFKDNINLWGNLINKRVKVTTDNGKDCEGIVKTIDPLTGSIVLLQFNNDDSKPTDLIIVTGHSVKSLSFQTDQQPITMDLRLGKEEEIDESELSDRREKLIKWFEKNRIPVEMNNNQELVVASSITIKSPYSKDDCSSSNVMVVRRIQDLMNRMPS